MQAESTNVGNEPALDPRIPYEIEIDVDLADIDQLGHVNNTVYLRWVQDVATAHWHTLTSGIDVGSLLWVVVKHEIEYKRPARLQDRILARTWTGSSHRLHFERFTEITRGGDGKLLASARTLWCPVDRHSLKPVRVSDQIREMFSRDDAVAGRPGSSAGSR
jgi:acyl-CoA thioester hydrolase